jgi:hypothetical protein
VFRGAGNLVLTGAMLQCQCLVRWSYLDTDTYLLVQKQLYEGSSFSFTFLFLSLSLFSLSFIDFFFFTFEISDLYIFGLGFISSLPQYIWD